MRMKLNKIDLTTVVVVVVVVVVGLFAYHTFIRPEKK